MIEHAPLLLPDAAWRHEPGLLRVLNALGGTADMTRAVGGAVRDTLAGMPVADVDLATRLLPDAVVRALGDAGIKAVPTGIAHGTITAIADGRPYEVTTLRRDVATDGRHAIVAFTDDWAQDAARRDFTINALYADPVAGTIYDPTGGRADLLAGRVQFIGDAGQRIDEDHLRILRWFRFLARFGQGGVDGDTLALIGARAPQLRALSRERVADELLRILALADPVSTLQLMVDSGVMAEIAPEAGSAAPRRVAALVAREMALGLPVDAVRRLIALLPADGAVADGVAARLKLSNRVRKRIATARGAGPVAAGAAGARIMAYHHGVDGARDQLLLAADGGDGTATWAAGAAPGAETWAAAWAALDGWSPPRLPISGGALMARGAPAGPGIA
ncbi:MAG: CCA tRNA nucleotidyltransferase, partial [Sphingopyxis sp.]